MAASLDAAAVKRALQRWADAVQASAPELNELDGRLGDGDLGATLEKCATNVRAALVGTPEAIDAIFKACAQACAKASGSSFGTLLAQAFLVAAKRTGTQPSIGAGELSAILQEIVAVLSARGGAKLGDKTMLDSLDAIASALAAAPAAADRGEVALRAAEQALDDFRGLPNKIGRARMFAYKSIGLDDPGMVAIARMAASLTSAAPRRA